MCMQPLQYLSSGAVDLISDADDADRRFVMTVQWRALCSVAARWLAAHGAARHWRGNRDDTASGRRAAGAFRVFARTPAGRLSVGSAAASFWATAVAGGQALGRHRQAVGQCDLVPHASSAAECGEVRTGLVRWSPVASDRAASRGASPAGEQRTAEPLHANRIGAVCGHGRAASGAQPRSAGPRCLRWCNCAVQLGWFSKVIFGLQAPPNSIALDRAVETSRNG